MAQAITVHVVIALLHVPYNNNTFVKQQQPLIKTFQYCLGYHESELRPFGLFSMFMKIRPLFHNAPSIRKSLGLQVTGQPRNFRKSAYGQIWHAYSRILFKHPVFSFFLKKREREFYLSLKKERESERERCCCCYL